MLWFPDLFNVININYSILRLLLKLCNLKAGSTKPAAETGAGSVVPTCNTKAAVETGSSSKAGSVVPASDTKGSHANDPWGENDEIEYVGVDDEMVFHADLISDNDGSDYILDTNEEDNDDSDKEG